MTVSEYVKRHPRTQLAAVLARKFGARSRKQIWIGSGIVRGGGGYGSKATRGGTNGPNSNIAQLMRKHNAYNYVVGGRAGINARDGNYFAVFK